MWQEVGQVFFHTVLNYFMARAVPGNRIEADTFIYEISTA
jgi:hypothetical protein